MTKTRKPGMSRRSTLALMGAGAVTTRDTMGGARASQDHQDRHADDPVRPRGAARNLVAQRRDAGGRQGQRRGRVWPAGRSRW